MGFHVLPGSYALNALLKEEDLMTKKIVILFIRKAEKKIKVK